MIPTGVQREIVYERDAEPPVSTHFVVSPVAEAESIPTPPEPPPPVPENLEESVRLAVIGAAHNARMAHEILETIRCETGGTFDPGLQSYVVHNGIREDSWGLAQIHLPSHPDITRGDATDPTFSIHFMVREFAAGNQWKWSCWKLLAWQGKI